MEMQKKLNHEDVKKMPTLKNLQSISKLEHIEMKQRAKKLSVERRQMSDFDQLLELIGNCPSLKKKVTE